MQTREPSRSARFALSLTILIVLLIARWQIIPRLGTAFDFPLIILATLLAACYGGFGPAAFVSVTTLAVSFIALAYFGPPPPEQAAATNTGEENLAVAVLFYLSITLGIALLGARMSSARRRAEGIAEQLRTTLASIGDAVLVTDAQGRIRSLNPVAEQLTGWRTEEAVGRSLSNVFMIINEQTEQPVENPAARALREGIIVGLANHTLLVAKDGTRTAIDDSAAPIRATNGEVIGVVLVFRDVSERRRAENQLRKEQSRFAAVIHHSPASIFAKDLQGQYLFGNRALANLVGCGISDFSGRTDADFFPAAAREVLARDDEHVVRCGEGHTREVTIPLSGRNVTMLITKFPLRDAEGDIYGVCGIATDVTQLKQTQQALYDNEERLRLALEAGRMGVWDWHVRTNEVSWTKNLESIHGLAAGSFDGTFEGFQALVHPADREYVNRAIQNALEARAAYHIQFRVQGSDGSIKWISGKGRVYSDALGPVRMIGIAVDITDQKLAEQTSGFLASASAELASLFDYHRTLQKVARLAVPFFADWCAIHIVDSQGQLRRVAVANPDLVDRDLDDPLNQCADDRRPPPFGLSQIVRTGQSELVLDVNDDSLKQLVQDADELQVLRQLGPRSYIVVPIKTRGHVLGVIAMFTAASRRPFRDSDLLVAEDLAHRAAVAMENAQLYQRVRDADRRKDEFLAMLAHELRNPLAPIRSGLELLSLSVGEHQDTIELMQEQVGHLVRMVDDLLDVSRIVRGRVELRQETVAFDTIVERLIAAARPVAEAHNQQLSAHIAHGPYWVNADRVRLTQIVENLLNNASKYTDRGGAITLSLSRQGETAVLEVKDTGIGIEPDLLPHVFDLFTQSSRALDRAQGGLGIGLTLVRTLVEMHHGSVAVHSEGTGRGSVFTVRLPLVEAPAERVVKPHVDSDGTARRILVVDDNLGAAKMLTLLIGKLGPHEVEMAHDGTSALHLVRATRPDIVLLDIGLPFMDGYEVGRAIRAEPTCDNILLVALTGYGQDEDRRRSRELGFDEHEVKPISADRLQSLLEHPKLRNACGRDM